MLILVAVTVSVVINSNLIGTAQNAADATKTAYEEEESMNKVTIGGKEYESFEQYSQIIQKGSSSKVIRKEEAINTKLNNANVKEVVRTETTTETYEAPIPVGFTVSKATGENSIADGLVIYEGDAEVNDSNVATAKTTTNQFVWIPVGEINSMVMCQTHETTATLTYNETSKKLECNKCKEAGITDTDFCGKLYQPSIDITELDLSLTGQTYDSTSGLREPAVLTSEKYGDGYIASSTNNTGKGAYLLNTILGIENNEKNLSTIENWYANKTVAEEVRDNFGELMQERFNIMATSVAKNKGFYVGRYEVSLNGEIAESKGNKAPAVDENWYKLYKYTYNYSKETDTTKGVVSEMIWGCQWDQIIIFLRTRTKDDTGNNFSISSGNPVRHDSSEVKNTALNVNDKVANLYDLEGNCYEWSQEAKGESARVHRGR